MRYYHVIFNTSSEEIKEKAKVNLREYSYDSPIASVNNYMYRNLQKELSFLAYQEEENLVYAVFAYNEKKNNSNRIRKYFGCDRVFGQCIWDDNCTGCRRR